MKKITTSLIIVAMAFLASCGTRDTSVWDPLIMKYLWHPSRVTIHSDQNGIYARSEIDGERILLGWLYLTDSPTDGTTYSFPGLVTLLQQGGIVVTNSIIASDIRRLADLASKGQFNQQYLVNSVRTTGGVWIVEDAYCGGPDDAHRRPWKITHTIYCSPDGLVTNLTKQLHPRPIDLEESQNKAVLPIAASAAQGDR